MPSQAPDAKSRIRSVFGAKGKVVIVGIGNLLRGDDGFGPALIERLSGNVEARCIDAGMDGYLAKPYRPQELFEAVERVAAASRQA